ncbi:hypothetical protein [Thermospira aquatica]|uniref:Uncharacterized protein n=1 Tax=Thermospira aquatica TaxID=2828656 RepID=A0AAX3BE09_9SPIR|nr:hypothetical protein [Thermospira aquatica]URA10284.1 hypothetical protein KDW03_00315 [Thermospira aquatica]
MIPRGVKALLVLSGLFFLFVIGFLLIEVRQDVLMTKREMRKTFQVMTQMETQLQELMMEKSKLSLTVLSSSVKAKPIGYRDVYRVELSSKDDVVQQVKKESLLEVCLSWIREKFPLSRMEI